MANEEIVISSNSSNFEYESPEAGAYLARCYQIIDEGTHLDEFVGSKFPSKPTRRVILRWELLQDDAGNEVRMADGRPFSVSRKYTMSLNEKGNLLKDINAWRGVKLTKAETEAFKLSTLLGKFCMIQVTIEQSKNDPDRTYANVSAIMSTKKKADGVNPEVTFTVSNPDQEVFDELSQKMQERINSSDEMKDAPMAAGPRPERPEQAQPPSQAAAPAPKQGSIADDLDEAGF